MEDAFKLPLSIITLSYTAFNAFHVKPSISDFGAPYLDEFLLKSRWFSRRTFKVEGRPDRIPAKRKVAH